MRMRRPRMRSGAWDDHRSQLQHAAAYWRAEGRQDKLDPRGQAESRVLVRVQVPRDFFFLQPK